MAARTLVDRPLGTKHFEQVGEDLELKRKLGLEVWNTLDEAYPAHLQHRVMSYRRLYFAPSVALNGEYCMRARSLDMTCDQLDYGERLLPIQFNSEHIEHRYLQRTASLAAYETTAFAATAVIGTVLANICGGLTNQEGQIVSCPVMLPDPKGLFLGFSCSYGEGDRFEPSLQMTCRRTEQAGAKTQFYACGDGTPYPRQPADPPASRAWILVNTFIGMGEVSSRQKAVWNQFQALMPEITRKGFIDQFVSDYAQGTLGNTSSPFTPDFNRVTQAVHAIAATPEWRESALKSAKAMSSFRWNEGKVRGPAPKA